MIQHHRFDPVTSASTEQEKCMVHVHGELFLNDRTESIDGFTHVCAPANDVDRIHPRDIG